MTHYSRAQWSQIAKRVRSAGYQFKHSWKCLICGHRFGVCMHSESDNLEVIREVQLREAQTT